MIGWPLAFLLSALLTGIFGFGFATGMQAVVFRVGFAVFLVLAVITRLTSKST